MPPGSQTRFEAFKSMDLKAFVLMGFFVEITDGFLNIRADQSKQPLILYFI